VGFASWEEAQPVGSKVRKMNQIEVRRRHATSGLTIRGAKLFFKKVHTLRGWDRREARLRLFGNPKHITPKFASCATSITWRATRPWARQSGARSYAIVDICICRETGERGANPILSKRGKLRTDPLWRQLLSRIGDCQNRSRFASPFHFSALLPTLEYLV
jgi:hypothetical protein